MFGIFALDLPSLVNTAFENVLLAEILTTLVGLVIWALVFMVVSASLLKFPMRAVDLSGDELRNADNLIRGNIHRMTGVFILGDFITFTAFDYIVGALANEYATVQPNVETSSWFSPETLIPRLYTTLGLLWLAVTAVMLSMIYKQLSENVVLPEKVVSPLPPSDYAN